jgi:hypothetical protein
MKGERAAYHEDNGAEGRSQSAEGKDGALMLRKSKEL